MLKNLIRYDLGYIFKLLVIFYSLAAVFSILTKCFFYAPDSLIFTVIREICLGAAISMICSTLINNIIRMWVRFKNNLYGDESYLTHTLPIEKSTHYFSKILTAVISLFVSFLIITVLLILMFYSKENLLMIKNIILPLAELYDSSILGLLLVFIFILFLEFLNILQCGFTGIILGNKMNSSRTGFTVLFGFISFAVSQWLVLIPIGVIALFNKSFMSLFLEDALVSIDAIKMLIVTAIAAYTGVSVLICLVNIKLLKKGVNVD